MDIYKQYLVKNLAERNDLDENQIDTIVDIFEKGYIDSIGIFSLLVEIEDDLGIELNLEDISSLNIYNIDNIASIIETKCQ